MNWLTQSEQKVLLLVVGVILTVWAVKTRQAEQPPAIAVQPAQP